MLEFSSVSDRDTRIAQVLRPLGTLPLTREQAVRAAQLLGVHWTTVYRLRARFLSNPVTSSLSPRKRGPRTGFRSLGQSVEQVVEQVLVTWPNPPGATLHCKQSINRALAPPWLAA